MERPRSYRIKGFENSEKPAILNRTPFHKPLDLTSDEQAEIIRKYTDKFGRRGSQMGNDAIKMINLTREAHRRDENIYNEKKTSRDIVQESIDELSGTDLPGTKVVIERRRKHLTDLDNQLETADQERKKSNNGLEPSDQESH